MREIICQKLEELKEKIHGEMKTAQEMIQRTETNMESKVTKATSKLDNFQARYQTVTADIKVTNF